MLRPLSLQRALFQPKQLSLSDSILLSYLQLMILDLKRSLNLVSIFLLIYFSSSLILTLLSALYSEIAWHSLYPVLNFIGTILLDILGIATAASCLKSQRLIDSKLSEFSAQMFISLCVGIGIYGVFHSVMFFDSVYIQGKHEYGMSLSGGIGIMLVYYVAVECVAVYYAVEAIRLHGLVDEVLKLYPDWDEYMSRLGSRESVEWGGSRCL